MVINADVYVVCTAGGVCEDSFVEFKDRASLQFFDQLSAVDPSLNSVVKCKAKCLENADCMGVNWLRVNHACIMYDRAVKDTTFNLNVDLYVREFCVPGMYTGCANNSNPLPFLLISSDGQ